MARLWGPGIRRGLIKTVVSMEPRHLEALRAEARRRMMERKVRRIDTSEIVREAIEFWLKRDR